MKKKLSLVIFAAMLFLSTTLSYAKNYKTPELALAIKDYKAGNYSECYYKLEKILKEDSSNALAYYYMAITSAQIGRRNEAISNYEKVLMLSPENNNLRRYAQKGKLCIEDPAKCTESYYASAEEEFIQKKMGSKFSKEVQSNYENLKIQNLMREINRKNDVEMQKFEEFKDFSTSVPTDEEIVAALRVLQKAGFNNFFSNNGFNDLSVLLGKSNQNTMSNLLDASSSLNPQLIQAFLTNNLTQGF